MFYRPPIYIPFLKLYGIILLCAFCMGYSVGLGWYVLSMRVPYGGVGAMASCGVVREVCLLGRSVPVVDSLLVGISLIGVIVMTFGISTVS